jgi:hypothetical protein
MKVILALIVGLALLAPINANAQTAYRLYWIKYYPLNPGDIGISLVDKNATYQSFSECEAAEATYRGGIREWANNGYYLCMESAG